MSFSATRWDLNPVLFDSRPRPVGPCTEAGTQRGPTLTHQAWSALHSRLLLEAGPVNGDPPQRILGDVVFFGAVPSGASTHDVLPLRRTRGCSRVLSCRAVSGSVLVDRSGPGSCEFPGPRTRESTDLALPGTSCADRELGQLRPTVGLGRGRSQAGLGGSRVRAASPYKLLSDFFCPGPEASDG